MKNRSFFGRVEHGLSVFKEKFLLPYPLQDTFERRRISYVIKLEGSFLTLIPHITLPSHKKAIVLYANLAPTSIVVQNTTI